MTPSEHAQHAERFSIFLNEALLPLEVATAEHSLGTDDLRQVFADVLETFRRSPPESETAERLRTVLARACEIVGVQPSAAAIEEALIEVQSLSLSRPAWFRSALILARDDLRFAACLATMGPTIPEKSTHEKLVRVAAMLLAMEGLSGEEVAKKDEDFRREFARVQKITSKLIDLGTTQWLAGLSTEQTTRPLGVFNPCSSIRSGVVELPGLDGEPELCLVLDVPAMGVRIADRAKQPPVVPARATGDGVLTNGILRIEIDSAGRISSLRREGSSAEWMEVEAGPLNQLVLVSHDPSQSPAESNISATPIEHDADSIEVIADGPLRAAIRSTRDYGTASRITQTFLLDAGSTTLAVHSTVEGRELATLLRVVFPVDAMSDASKWGRCEITRPAPNTSLDVSHSGKGLAVFSDTDSPTIDDSALGLTLAPSSASDADRGVHELTYAILPHDGNWRAANVDQEAEALTSPLVAYPLNPHEPGPLGSSWSPFRLEATGGGAVMIDTIRPGTHPGDFVLHLRESLGLVCALTIHWHIAIGSVMAVPPNDTTSPLNLSHEGNITTLYVQARQSTRLSVGRKLSQPPTP